jgi:Flp pilus assembly protein TadB
LGEYFDFDPVIIRVLWIVVTVFTGVLPGIAAYFIVALVVPLQGSAASTPRENIRETMTDIKDTAANIRDEVKTSLGTKESKTYSTAQPQTTTPSHGATSKNSTLLYVLGIIIIAVGVLVVLVNVISPWVIWSGLLIFAGLIILLLAWRRPRT